MQNVSLSSLYAVMNREEAIRLTHSYLAQEKEHHSLTLDHDWIVRSLTDYTACWYVDFRYRYAAGQVPPLSSRPPGFTIDKQAKHIRVISWQELYELNAEPLLC